MNQELDSIKLSPSIRRKIRITFDGAQEASNLAAIYHRDLQHTRKAIQERQSRKKNQKRVFTGGAITVANAREKVKERAESELSKAQRLVHSAQYDAEALATKDTRAAIKKAERTAIEARKAERQAKKAARDAALTSRRAERASTLTQHQEHQTRARGGGTNVPTNFLYTIDFTQV